jgi:hypothetical protein
MRAIIIEQFGGPEKLVIKNLPDPEPAPGNVIIEVKAFGINHAETHMRKGEWAEAANVIPEARNCGIGRSFFKFLGQTRPFEAVALALEVSPGNTGALRLYESLGFRQQRNLVLNCSLTGDSTRGL